MINKEICADVAELADALALGASGFTVGVRIPSSAPFLLHKNGCGSFHDPQMPTSILF